MTAPLTTIIKINGTTLTQLARVGDIALYESELGGYEVVKIRVRKARTLPNGSHREAAESYPSSEQWGRYGLTFSFESHARFAFEHEVEAQRLEKPFGSSATATRLYFFPEETPRAKRAA